MEVLLDNLTFKTDSNQTIQIIVSPKYNCKLAGEGIEYARGAIKWYFRRLPLEEKNNNNNFEKAGLDTFKHVKKAIMDSIAL